VIALSRSHIAVFLAVADVPVIRAVFIPAALPLAVRTACSLIRRLARFPGPGIYKSIAAPGQTALAADADTPGIVEADKTIFPARPSFAHVSFPVACLIAVADITVAAIRIVTARVGALIRAAVVRVAVPAVITLFSSLPYAVAAHGTFSLRIRLFLHNVPHVYNCHIIFPRIPVPGLEFDNGRARRDE